MFGGDADQPWVVGGVVVPVVAVAGHGHRCDCASFQDVPASASLPELAVCSSCAGLIGNRVSRGAGHRRSWRRGSQF